MAWSEIRGHDARVSLFRAAFARGRLAHAYLFAGPAGVGKRRFAVELAKALLCEAAGRPDPFDACGTCPACRLVDAGSHPDLTVLGRQDDENTFGVDRVREFCEALALKPSRGGRKVAVLDDADDLTEQAANCFLKTLEEPAPGSLLVLLGSSPEVQLPTVVSRCQVVRFAPLPADVVRELLTVAGVEEDALDRLVRLSAGSPGQALELAEPALWQFRRRVLESLAADRPDTVALGRGWEEFTQQEANPPRRRRRATAVLRLVIGLLDQAVRLSLGVVPDGLEPGERPLLERLAGRYGTDGLLALLDRCLAADDQLASAPLALVLEALTDAFAPPGPAGGGR